MTDSLIDDDVTEIRASLRSGTTRRPMFIETEIRTDSVTTRRMAAAAANRSLNEILESTKSPTHDRPATNYTYAHTQSYSPSTRQSAYEIPVMARRSLHNNYSNNTESRFNKILSIPSQIFSNIRSGVETSYGFVRNRVIQLTGYQQQTETDSPNHTDMTTGGTRFSRTSSQSSSGSRSTGYNLRSRPVHSTPRDNDNDQQRRQKTRKDNQNQDEIDENDDEHKSKQSQKQLHQVCQCFTKLIRSPIELIEKIFNNLKILPWWLLIPIFVLLGLYALPYLACKPFERYHHVKVNNMCRQYQSYTSNLIDKTYKFTRHHTYERGVNNFRRFSRSVIDIKQSVSTSLYDLWNSIKRILSFSYGGVKSRVADVVETTAEKSKEYYDAGVQKLNSLIEELKQEREKYTGVRHALKPDEENELREIVRKMIEEYAADETALADFALEANGGKIVDTRCQEYTDEPRQNVVKFLGIPIVHMSKHPDIIIKHGRMPGQCFPFKGDHGSVVIRLAVPVVPTEFVVEHLSKSISIVGHINSAPKNFTVYALRDKHDKEGVVLGRYVYDAENGPSLQRFKPQIAKMPIVEYIEVQVTSNWGNPAYTCLYRFRVHGDMQTAIPPAA